MASLSNVRGLRFINGVVCGLYELTPNGSVLRSWTGSPGLGERGVYALANGRHLIGEAGGNSAIRGLGTLDANGVANNSNFELTLGFVNGGWISAAVVPEPATWVLWGCGLAVVVISRRRAVTARRQ